MIETDTACWSFCFELLFCEMYGVLDLKTALDVTIRLVKYRLVLQYSGT